jgi:hypothetical protein
VKTNVRIALGIVIIILGLLVAITPRYLFPVCEYHVSESSANTSMGANMTTGTTTGSMDTMTSTTGTMTGAMNNMQTTTSTNSDSNGMAGMDMGDNSSDNGGASPTTHHMQCYYTSRGALLLGLLTMLIGVGLIIATTAEAIRLLALVLGGTGVVVILTPTYFLPICENPQMACHDGSEPMLIVLGAAMLVVAAITALLSGKNQAGSS